MLMVALPAVLLSEREPDEATGIGDQSRRAAGCGVAEVDAPACSGVDGGVAGRAAVQEGGEAAIDVRDGGVASCRVVVEGREAVVGVGDGGVAGRAVVRERDIGGEEVGVGRDVGVAGGRCIREGQALDGADGNIRRVGRIVDDARPAKVKRRTGRWEKRNRLVRRR